MGDIAHIESLDFFIGLLIVAAIFLRDVLAKFQIPPIVGYVILGFLVRAIDNNVDIISEHGLAILEFLAGVGVFVILFRVGLDSDLHGLKEKLPDAVPIWIGNVVLSAVPAGALAYWVFGLGVVPSLFTAIALSATSVTIGAGVWSDAGALKTPLGDTFLDVAELDDLSAIILMAFMIALTPVILSGNNGALLSTLGGVTLIIAAKAVFFGVMCYLIARFATKPLSHHLVKMPPTNASVLVLGIGIAIAGVAGILGFSVAIGAFFAGLIFSRDPETVRLETLFEPLHTFFAPFFFIHIGFAIDPSALGSAWGIGLALLGVAIVGKLVGAGLPALPIFGTAGATVIAVSMVPRAEMALVIMQEGSVFGAEAVPPQLLAAIAVVSLATCVVFPYLITRAIGKLDGPGSKPANHSSK